MPKGKRPRLDPADVLEGRVRPDIQSLLSLIHDVNPTGRDHLPDAEITRRYAQKARLQSLLVRRFADALEVEPVADQPRLVTLRHRASGVDACHALIVGLDEDARAWVESALDQMPPSSAGPSPMHLEAVEEESPGSLSVPELVAAGRDAIDGYDYPLAREHLDAALSRGSERAAVLLLELLVDLLGADDEALALEPRLPPAARERAPVRALLALAAARSGDREDALERIRGLAVSERGAAAHAALGRRAVEAREAREARYHLDQVREHSPAHPEVAGLAAAIDALCAPLEEEALHALAEGRVHEAYARADELLARFPASQVGLRLSRRREEERRVAEAARLARDAEEAIVAGALSEARFLVIKASAEGLIGPRRAGLSAQIAALEARARARAEAARLDEVAGLLEAAELAPGLHAYLALDAGARAAVRARCGLPQLGWLDLTGVDEGTGPQARATVSAVLALTRAHAEVARDPRGTLDLLAPHRKSLADVPLAEALVQTAQRALVEERRRRASARLDAALRAFTGDDTVTEVTALLADVAARDLDDAARARRDDLEERLQLAGVRRERRRAIEILRKDGDPLTALAALADLAEAGPASATRDEVERILDELTAELRAAFAVQVESPPAGARSRLVGPAHADPPRSILPGGAELCLAQSYGRWVFLWVIDIASGAVRRRARLRVSAPIRLQRVVLEGKVLLLIGRTGTVVELDVESLLPESESTSEISPDLDSDVAVAPGRRCTWVCSGQAGAFDIDVWDGERGEWCRNAPDTTREVALTPLYGLAGQAGATSITPAMAVIRPFLEESISLHAAHGPQLATYRRVWLVPKTLVVHPSGDALLAIERSMSDGGRLVRHRFVELTTRGLPLRAADPETRVIADLGDPPYHVVVDAAAGLVFVQVHHDGEPELLAVKTAPRGSKPRRDGLARPLAIAYRVPLPARTILVEDPAGGPAVAVARHEDDFEVVRLGADPPSFRGGDPGLRVPATFLPYLASIGSCDHPGGARGEHINRLLGALMGEGAAATTSRIAAATRAGPAALCDLVHVLHRVRNNRMWELAMDAVVTSFPDHPEALLVAARRRSAVRDWSGARDLLRRVDLAALGEGQARHVHHLLGLALVALGEGAEALEVLRSGEALPGSCDLGLALTFALPLDDPGAATHPWSSVQRGIRALRGLTQTADDRLRDGDALGAVAALDVLGVHDLAEVQSLARLCEAHLAVPDGGPVEAFDKALALAAFTGAHGETGRWSRRELPLVSPTWDGARLDALAARADAWLDGEPAPEEPLPREAAGTAEPPGANVPPMSQEDGNQAVREVTEVNEAILRDLQSKHADVICPIHNERPRFEIDEKGSVVESFCCDALLQMFRETGSREQP